MIAQDTKVVTVHPVNVKITTKITWSSTSNTFFKSCLCYKLSPEILIVDAELASSLRSRALNLLCDEHA